MSGCYIKTEQSPSYCQSVLEQVGDLFSGNSGCLVYVQINSVERISPFLRGPRIQRWHQVGQKGQNGFAFRRAAPLCMLAVSGETNQNAARDGSWPQRPILALLTITAFSQKPIFQTQTLPDLFDILLQQKQVTCRSNFSVLHLPVVFLYIIV